MRRAALTFVNATLVLLLASCGASQKYAYLADAPRDQQMAITASYESRIYPGDQLYIYVYSETPALVRAFNEETNKVLREKSIRGYLVSEEGDIMFPVLGRLHVEGMTREGLARELEARLIEGRYVADPVVTVSLMNFRVAVIGEVRKPSQITAVGDRLTIFEAIAQCGDITMDGLRDCVTVLRSMGDDVVVDTVDLTSRDVLDSPYYYLKQNDVVYVQPTARKKRKAYRDEDWPRYVSTSVGMVHTAYLLVYRYVIRGDIWKKL